MLLTVVGGLGLGRWDHAEFAVKALVVEPVDVAERRELNFIEALPEASRVDEPPFVEGVETLSERVVVAVAA